MKEVQEKQRRLARLMKERRLGAVVLSRRHNFAWATGGADNHVRHASDLGVASLVFLSNGMRRVLTSNIESPRIMGEELKGLGFALKEFRWYSPADKARALRELIGNRKCGSDDGTPGSENIEPHMPSLRMALSPAEITKYRWLGRTAGRVMGEVCRSIRRGMSEEEIAGALFAGMQKRSVKPTVMLVAADDRIASFRHPIPTRRRVRKAVMVVTCARRWGLLCSLTRLVHFGKLPVELRRKHEAAVRVDAQFMLASRPGIPYADVFELGRRAYAACGFPGEWTFHHQGGPTGYIEREFTVNSETDRNWRVEPGHAIAWNPSISGTKSEDTIIVTRNGPEIISRTPGWPAVKARVGDRIISRPDWLVRG